MPFGSTGLAEALYLSGASLTTVGFGDVVGSGSAIRLLTVVEAAAGLGVLTATLGYLPTIYSLVSELRATSQAVADLDAQDPRVAASLLAVDAAATLDGVRRDVLVTRQHLLRFPVLHTFHAPYDESVVALARGAVGLWVAGFFATDTGRPLDRQLAALRTALCRLTDELAAHADGTTNGTDPAADVARARSASLGDDDEAGTRDPKHDSDGFGEDDLALLRRMHAVLDAYAVSHGYPTHGEQRAPAATATAG